VSTPIGMEGAPVVGLGCMRLSTERDRDAAGAIAVLHAALDAGITFFDTADAYCWDSAETGHNERLIATALRTWTGDRSRIVVATKGGLTRPQGNWIEDGRARSLYAACDASRRALDVGRIQLYQLHAPDPRTPLSTSVRALAALQRDGLIEKIGLCNVNVSQIRDAREVAEIATVQVELSVWREDALLGGVVQFCLANGIHLIAHRPLGGVRARRRTSSDAVLAELAQRHDATPFEIALAWLNDLSSGILPIPGATRVDTVRSIARVRQIAFTDEERALLDEKFPVASVLRASHPTAAPQPVDGEAVLIMGLPAAGKSTLARTFVARGYERLNRDEAGGSLRGLLPGIDRLLAADRTRIVLDNTYATRKSRAPVIQAARARGLPIRCACMSTTLEDAQVNAASRMIAKYGRLLEPEEMRKLTKRDPNAFGPAVQFRYQRELEPPDPSEGFSHIDVVPFERRRDPSLTNRAVIVWCDGVLVRSRLGARAPTSVDDTEVVAANAAILRRYADEGWRVLGLSWQPDVSGDALSMETVDAIFNRMREELEVPIDVSYCPHGGGPPTCWCRKPLPGLGVALIQRYLLDASRCIYVGVGPQDPGFARRLGFQFVDALEFFDMPGRSDTRD
jgi:aryl-alcohol dehydrogenase-like predicted oxidoreductase/histidinol phosphatase-like enzyme